MGLLVGRSRVCCVAMLLRCCCAAVPLLSALHPCIVTLAEVHAQAPSPGDVKRIKSLEMFHTQLHVSACRSTACCASTTPSPSTVPALGKGVAQPMLEYHF